MAEFPFKEDDFGYNSASLEEMTGCRSELVPIERTELKKPNGENMIVKAEKGKFVSSLLFYQLSIIFGDEFIMEGMAYDLMRAFFAPLWSDPIGKHPTIDFLREPGVRVKIIK